MDTNIEQSSSPARLELPVVSENARKAVEIPPDGNANSCENVNKPMVVVTKIKESGASCSTCHYTAAVLAWFFSFTLFLRQNHPHRFAHTLLADIALIALVARNSHT